MVVLEGLVLGKGAAAGAASMGAAKVAAGGSTAATGSVLAPVMVGIPPDPAVSSVASHGLTVGLPKLSFSGVALGALPAINECGVDLLTAAASVGHHILDIAGSATAAVGVKLSYVAPVAKESIAPLAVSCGAYSVMRWWGLFGTEEEEEEDDELRVFRGPMRVVPSALGLCAFSDCFVATVVVQSLGTPLPIPLRTWVVGGILLGFPGTVLVDKVVQKDGVRYGFCLEVLMVAAAYGWLPWGTVLLSNSPGWLRFRHYSGGRPLRNARLHGLS